MLCHSLRPNLQERLSIYCSIVIDVDEKTYLILVIAVSAVVSHLKVNCSPFFIAVELPWLMFPLWVGGFETIC